MRGRQSRLTNTSTSGRLRHSVKYSYVLYIYINMHINIVCVHIHTHKLIFQRPLRTLKKKKKKKREAYSRSRWLLNSSISSGGCHQSYILKSHDPTNQAILDSSSLLKANQNKMKTTTKSPDMKIIKKVF